MPTFRRLKNVLERLNVPRPLRQPSRRPRSTGGFPRDRVAVHAPSSASTFRAVKSMKVTFSSQSQSSSHSRTAVNSSRSEW